MFLCFFDAHYNLENACDKTATETNRMISVMSVKMKILLLPSSLFEIIHGRISFTLIGITIWLSKQIYIFFSVRVLLEKYFGT